MTKKSNPPAESLTVDATCIVKKAFHSGGAFCLGETVNMSREDAKILAVRGHVAEPGSAAATKAEKEAAAQAEKAAQFKERRR